MNKETLDYFNTSKYYDNSNAFFVGKMKDEMGPVDIENFLGLNPKMYLILVSYSSQYKKQKMWIKILLRKQVTMNIRMFCWIKNV